jgi:hypothetical protein
MSSSNEGASEDEGPDEGGGAPATLRLGDQELVLRQRFEVASIANEILVALCFAVGSVAFYWEELFNLGVTLFVIGSVLIGIRPLMRFVRRTQLTRITRGTPQEVARDF